MHYDQMQQGKFTQADAKVTALAHQLQQEAIDSNTTTLHKISEYIKTLKHDDSHKADVFRKRTASEIITSGTETGCTDCGHVFLALARAAGIPALYIETFKADTLGTTHAGAEGHVFAQVFDRESMKWKIYEPKQGYADTFTLGGAHYVPAGVGMDCSAVYPIAHGAIGQSCQCVDTLQALHQLAGHSICVPCEYVQPHHVQHSGQAALAI